MVGYLPNPEDFSFTTKGEEKKMGKQFEGFDSGGGGEAVRRFYNNHLYNQIENYILLLES